MPWLVANPKCTDPSNPECSNYDPCWGKSELSSDFAIEERIFIGWKNNEAQYYFSETDSAITSENKVVFTAKATDYDSP